MTDLTAPRPRVVAFWTAVFFMVEYVAIGFVLNDAWWAFVR